MQQYLRQSVWAVVAASSLSTAAHSGDGPGLAPVPPRVHFQGTSQELPMSSAADRLLVHGMIGDAGPFAFLIDTGAGVSVVDSKIAADLSLAKVGNLAVGAPGGNQVETDRVLVPSLTVNGLSIEQLSPIVLDIEAMTGGLFQGVLGMDVFGDLTLTIDPFRKLASVSREPLRAGSAGVISYDDAQGRMEFMIDVEGVAVPMQIDTGAPGAFTIPPRYRPQLNIDSDSEHERTAMLVGGPRKVTTARLLGSVSFAGLRFDNPSIAFMDPSPPTGNIGGEILKQLVISIDGRNRLLAFHQPASEPTSASASTAGTRRLGVQFGGGPGRSLADVGGVAPDSVGERAGFRAGDRIVSLNDKAIAEYDIAALGATIRGEGTLRFVVLREATEHLIEIE